MTNLILYDPSIVQMHKLVKCKSANHHFAYLRTFEFVHLYKSTIILDVYHELSLTFACMRGINELQSFTFAQTKWKKRKIQRCKCKTQIKRQANQKGGE